MEFLNRCFYTALGAFSIIYFIIKYSLSHWKKRGILHEKPKLLWGNLKGVGKKRHIVEALQEYYEKYKNAAPFIGFYAWLRPMLLILDLNLVERVLKTDSEKYFHERALYSNANDEPLTANLIQLDGECYKHLYRKIYKCYDIKNLQSIIWPTLIRVANNYKMNLEKQQNIAEIFPIKLLADSYNSDVLAKLAFNLDCDSMQYPQNEFHVMCSRYTQNVTLLKIYLAWSFPILARLLQYKIYDRVAANYFHQIVRNKLEETAQRRSRLAGKTTSATATDAIVNRSFLDLFSECSMNSNEIAAECFTFLLAGLEASNSTLSFCLYEMARAPILQEQARREIENVLVRHKDKLTWECVQDMRFLKQILNETLRLHSPYPFLLRNTAEDYEVPDSVFMLKQGNAILIPIHAIHNDPKIYPHPKRFDPSRFEAAAIQQRHPMSFIPFGCGPRACIARRFVEMQLLVGLITILQQYRIEFATTTTATTIAGTYPAYDNRKILVTPKSDVMVRLIRIKQ